MNSQCRGIHLSTSPSQRYQLSCAAQSWQSPQNYDGRLNATVFERLLHFLGPDACSADRKYESIRARLITMFSARRCLFAEDLADITIERVAHKLTTLTSQFIGDPAPYFFGVARKIYLEYLRELKAHQLRATCCPPATSTDNPHSEEKLELLEKALSMIPNADRELILKYYSWTGENKIVQRRALADQLNIGLNALRLRVFRIRKEIKKHILQLDPETGEEA